MTETIERVAQAIWWSDEVLLWDQDDPERHKVFLSMARKAIAAIREPSPDMIAAGYGSLGVLGQSMGMGPGDVMRSWRAMIDAALRS